MKETITKVGVIALLLLFMAGILSLSAVIFVAGLITVAVLGGYISLRRWWLRKKGIPVPENRWEQAFSETFTSSSRPNASKEESITIIEVDYEEVEREEKDKP